MNQLIKLQYSEGNIAQQIGRHYRAGWDEMVMAGEKLIIQKESMGHGEWLPWLRVNEDVLGFGESTAQRLMKLAANPALTRDLWGNNNHRAIGTGENEWYTPAKYIELARSVLGEIDLDPATSEIAQNTVRAAKWFDAKSDGLTKDWYGRIWLNPPYAQPLIGQFVSKLMEQLAASNVQAAIMLTHNYTDTSWFHEAAELTNSICFTRGRIKFVDANGGECAPTQGQSFFYYGPNAEIFREKFIDVGFVMRA